MHDVLEKDQIFAGRYRIHRFLAKGGFGAVYEAERVDTEARVALKVLWPNVLETNAAMEQFSLEARVASRISSEHVVNVFDVGADAKTQRPFLAMELLVGKHFEELVEEHGPLPYAELAVYYRQIGSALDKAHGYVDRSGTRRPIIHRDLKPENLFLTHRENGEPLVKILDFGLAKVLTDTANTSRELKGTPLFMAFEQAAVAPVTPQTDIWALGLIAFYLLTGKIYWLSANTDESPFSRLFTEVLSTPLDPPSERARVIGSDVELPAGFDEWFDRCVNRDASQRFQTAGECAEALAALLVGGEPARKRPESRPPPRRITESAPTVRSPTPFSASFDKRRGAASESVVTGRRRVLRGVVGAMIAALVVGLGVVFSGAFRGKPPESPAEPAKPSNALPAPETASAVSPVAETPSLAVSIAPDAERSGAPRSAGPKPERPPVAVRPVSGAPAASGRLPNYVYGER
jgi:eukaryotic-like serine/threonine-protein kinase